MLLDRLGQPLSLLCKPLADFHVIRSCSHTLHLLFTLVIFILTRLIQVWRRRIPKLNLAAYSHHARHLYFPGSNPKMFAVGKRNTSNHNEFDLGPDMDEDYARVIVTHIKSADPTDPKPLTMQVFGKDLSMGDLVKVYRLIGAGFKVPREVHQDDVRGHLRGMIYTADPFELYHFKVIAENLDFDRGLVHSAMDRVVYLHIKEELADESGKIHGMQAIQTRNILMSDWID